jgi:hypothetical protein
MKQLSLFEADNLRQKRIFWPCPIAREMLIGEERLNHIKNCSECKRIKEELDKSVYRGE